MPVKGSFAKNNSKSRGGDSRHPFGGCNRLLEQYRVIGAELLKYEDSRRLQDYGAPDQAFYALRVAVSFVPVEVLESFLEDLLDLDISDDVLFIRRKAFSLAAFFSYVPLVGLLLSVGAGLYAAYLGGSMLLSFALTILLALPFAAMWYLSPSGMARRMLFAQVISREIGRRRGNDKDLTPIGRRSFDLRSIFGARSPQSAPGASMQLFH